MRTILGHRSWNEEEVLAFFDGGSFTMCNLPHFRFRRVKEICRSLKQCGLIEKTGGMETGVSYLATPAYHQWRTDVKEGKATSSLDKLFKQQHPPKLLQHRCRQCRAQYETYDFAQKFCSKTCKADHRRKAFQATKEGQTA